MNKIIDNLKFASEEKQKLGNWIYENSKENLVHIHIVNVAKVLNISRPFLMKTINWFLEKNIIQPFFTDIRVYKISQEFEENFYHKVPVLVNGEMQNIDRLSGFNSEEISYIEKFEMHRNQIGKPLSPISYEEMINRAIDFKARGFNVVECIQYAISGGYPQFFEPKINININSQPKTFQEMEVERNRKIRAEFDNTENILNNMVKNKGQTNDTNNIFEIGYTKSGNNKND